MNVINNERFKSLTFEPHNRVQSFNLVPTRDKGFLDKGSGLSLLCSKLLPPRHSGSDCRQVSFSSIIFLIWGNISKASFVNSTPSQQPEKLVLATHLQSKTQIKTADPFFGKKKNI